MVHDNFFQGYPSAVVETSHFCVRRGLLSKLVMGDDRLARW